MCCAVFVFSAQWLHHVVTLQTPFATSSCSFQCNFSYVNISDRYSFRDKRQLLSTIFSFFTRRKLVRNAVACHNWPIQSCSQLRKHKQKVTQMLARVSVFVQKNRKMTWCSRFKRHYFLGNSTRIFFILFFLFYCRFNNCEMTCMLQIRTDKRKWTIVFVLCVDASDWCFCVYFEISLPILNPLRNDNN